MQHICDGKVVASIESAMPPGHPFFKGKCVGSLIGLALLSCFVEYTLLFNYSVNRVQSFA